MSRKIIAFPPIRYTAWELHPHYQISRSRSLLSGASMTSSYQPMRRLALATVHGIRADGAGYLDMLKDQIEGGVHYVRVACMPAIWFFGRYGKHLAPDYVEWSSGDATLLWSSAGDSVAWADELLWQAEPAMDGAWFAITATGLPPSTKIVGPGEFIEVTDGIATARAKVMTVARSDSSGTAIIRIDRAIAVTGPLRVGTPESIVFEVVTIPRAVQGMSGQYNFDMAFREVLPAEYADLEEVDPWA